MLIDSIETYYDAQDTLCLESSLSNKVLVSGEVSHTWILDLGVSLHVTPHKEGFTHYKEIVGSTTFGCEAYAHVPKELRAKLDRKSQKCIFIGYELDGHFDYRLWDPQSQSIIYHSIDVVFNETKVHK